MLTDDFSQPHAWLRNAIASDQQRARGGVAGSMNLAAFEHGKPQRGIADRTCHHHSFAGLCPTAVNHLAIRHATERGYRDHHWARRRNRVAAEQRTSELRGVLAERRRERL